MDLIKYIPYIRATPQSLLKRTEGLLTIKKIMSYGVNGVSYLKERRVSKLQGTYNLPYYRIGRALAALRT